jgi:hypothetical protein
MPAGQGVGGALYIYYILSIRGKMRKEIGSCEMIQVFIDDFVGKKWVNIGKMGRIIKINPDLVDGLIELLNKAKEGMNNGL